MVLLLLVGLGVWAADPDPVAELGATLDSLRAYQSGTAGTAPARLEQLVVEMAAQPAARATAEEALIRALAAATTQDARDLVCRQLLLVGSPKAVPALEPWLIVPGSSHMARYVLARLAAPEAVAALRRALPRTSGLAQAGIADSLGVLRCTAAVPDLVALLRSGDPAVADSAAAALGRTGGDDALAALQSARATAAAARRPRLDDALLSGADQVLAAGDRARAGDLYEACLERDRSPAVRSAGLRGLVAARGEAALPHLVNALWDSAAVLRLAAADLSAGVPGSDATRVLAGLLPDLSTDARLALALALGRRGDPIAAPALARAASDPGEALRVAALSALGSAGDVSHLDLLLAAAAGPAKPEQEAARRSLTTVGGAAATAVLLQGLTEGPGPIRAERLRALAGRGAAEAVPPVLAVARADADTALRREAIRTLGALVTDSQLADLVGLVAKPRAAEDRSAAEEAVTVACRRIRDRDRQTAALVAAYPGAEPEAKAALLRLLGRSATPAALEAVRQGQKEADASVAEAALRALAAWPDASPADDLLALARNAASETHRILALRGYVRLADQSPDPAAMYARALDLAARPDEKKLAFGGLGSAGTVQALDLLLPYLKDKALRDEAGLAIAQVAAKLQEKDPKRAVAAVRQVLEAGPRAEVRDKAQEVLNEMEKFKDHIRAWVVAGPYSRPGTEGPVLLDTAFGPEAGDAAAWRPPKAGVGEWEVQLDSAIGTGDEIVGYLRTRVWAPAAQDARLEVGSDDGVKVWLNGQVVHTFNGNRAITACEDKVKVSLREGWNELQFKVVNHIGGWNASCRVRRPDGTALEGLKTEAPP